MTNWKGDLDEPVVSICCITYNHEAYIEDALEGFLMQETGFPFEILIHDDASTDRTADIIREYEAKYPRLIKPIYQTENQWSKGIRFMNPNFLYPVAKGEFIALCEGDDYWVSPMKLQRQHDVLLDNKDCSYVFHSVLKENKTFAARDVANWDKPKPKPKQVKSRFKDVVLSNFIPTLSLFFYKKHIPLGVAIYKEKIVSGDYFLVFMLSSKGMGYYLDENMGVHVDHDGGITKIHKMEELKDKNLDLDGKLELFDHLFDILPKEFHRDLKKAAVLRAYLGEVKRLFYSGRYFGACRLLVKSFIDYPGVLGGYLKRKVKYVKVYTCDH